MPIGMLLDYLAVRLDGPAADGEHLVIDLVLTDPDEERHIEVRRSVLHHAPGRHADAAVTLRATTASFKSLVTSTGTLEERLAQGDVDLDGDVEVFHRLTALLDDFHFWFPIIEP